MSTEIPAVPQLYLNVRYTRNVQEDRGEGEENEVEIFTNEEHQSDLGSQTTRPRTQKNPAAVKRSSLTVSAVFLGALYLLTLTGIFIRYISIKNSHSNLEDHITQLQTEVNKLRRNINGTLCPEGWERFRCSCYYKSTEMKSWDDSRADCKNRAAELVVVHSRDENEFLKELNKDGESWIGLQSVETKDWLEKWEWKWVDGSTLSYTDFAKDELLKPKELSTMSINQQGIWIANKGSKHWICEKEVS